MWYKLSLIISRAELLRKHRLRESVIF